MPAGAMAVLWGAARGRSGGRHAVAGLGGCVVASRRLAAAPCRSLRLAASASRAAACPSWASELLQSGLCGGSAAPLKAVTLALGAGCGCAVGIVSGLTRCDAAPEPVALVAEAVSATGKQPAAAAAPPVPAEPETGPVLPPPARTFSLWGELRVLVWENIVWIIAGTTCLVLATVFQTKNVGRLTAELTVKVLSFDAKAPDSAEQRKELMSVLWSMIYWQAATQTLSFIGGALNRIVSRRIRRGLQLSLYAELLSKDVTLFDQHQMGELTTCVEERVEKLSQVVSAVTVGLPALVGVPLTLVHMWHVSPEIASANAMMVVVTVSTLFVVYIIGIKRCSKAIAKQKALATSAVTESFFAIRTVHAFDAANQLVKRYENLLGASAWLEMVQQLAFQSLMQTFHSMQLLITVTTYMRGTRILTEQSETQAAAAAAAAAGSATSAEAAGTGGAPQLEAGSLSLFQQLCTDLFRGVMGLAGMGNAFGTAAGDVAAVEAILNGNPSSMLAAAGGRQLGSGCRGDIEMRDVTFSYPPKIAKVETADVAATKGIGSPKGVTDEETAAAAPTIMVEPPVLREATLRFPRGKVTAIVGSSGAGKSTVLDLVQRFHDVDSGSVTLDGVDVRELDVRWLRRQMGKVEQEPCLFALSIADNIRLGKPTASDAEVVAAATRAGAHAFITDQAGGYDAMVTEQGTSLSGGQKQRLAIARALVTNPRVLILDEASSALDATTEREVSDALQEVMHSRTTIVVAHRLSTVASADHIIVLDEGSVCEQGSHTDLLARGGKYAELVRHQTS